MRNFFSLINKNCGYPAKHTQSLTNGAKVNLSLCIELPHYFHVCSFWVKKWKAQPPSSPFAKGELNAIDSLRGQLSLWYSCIDFMWTRSFFSFSIALTTAAAPDIVVVNGTLYWSALWRIEKESLCACVPLTVFMTK